VDSRSRLVEDVIRFPTECRACEPRKRPSVARTHSLIGPPLQLVNGSDMYTSVFRGKVLSDAGQVLEMSRNASGYFVSSGTTTARVVKADVLLANGVVHVIDRVLRNTEVAMDVTSSAVGRKRLSVGTAATSWAVGIIVGMALI
jgi:hypothetical protein